MRNTGLRISDGIVSGISSNDRRPVPGTIAFREVGKIAQVVVGLPVEGPFDYLIGESFREKISIGSRVFVFFGPRRIVGYIVGFKEKSSFKKLKSIVSLIDEKPILSENLLKLAKEISLYYGCSWGEAIETALPQAIRNGKTVRFDAREENRHSVVKPETILVHDPSQKERWNFLAEHIQTTIRKNGGVIILVPEVSFVESVRLNLQEKITETIFVFDKKNSAKKTLEEWVQAKMGGAKIALGVRSAIFAPIQNLGLIVVFEDDNPAYKQEQSPFYHVREVSLMRSKIEHANLIFVSTVPSAQLWHRSLKKKLQLVSFPPEAKTFVQIVDMSNYYKRQMALLSIPLKNSIEKTLKTNGRALLFMNRKGFSTTTRCQKCDYTVRCPRCDIHLTYSFEAKKMVCRYCQFTATPPNVCPQCNSAYLRFSGIGIEKLESEVARLLPSAKVAHFDRDSKVIPADFQILIGTQAVLKLQGKISFDTIGVVQADNELNRPDFNSAQKTFSLFFHLKSMAAKSLIVQTRLPDNYCIKAIRTGDFKKFYRQELKLRRELSLPPFVHLISVMVRAPKESAASQQSQLLYKEICAKNKGKKIEALEPQADIIPKLRGKYRVTMFLKGKSVKDMLKLISLVQKKIHKKSGVFVSVNVDG